MKKLINKINIIFKRKDKFQDAVNSIKTIHIDSLLSNLIYNQENIVKVLIENMLENLENNNKVIKYTFSRKLLQEIDIYHFDESHETIMNIANRLADFAYSKKYIDKIPNTFTNINTVDNTVDILFIF